MKDLSKVFFGHNVKDNPLIIPKMNTPDCKNVRIDNPIGALNNEIGFEKQATYAYANDIVAIHQLNEFGRFGSSVYDGIITSTGDILVNNDTTVFEEIPDTNDGAANELFVSRGYPRGTNHRYTLIKQGSINRRYLNIYLKTTTGAPSPFIIDVYKIVDTWDANIVTWNTKPALGDLLVDDQDIVGPSFMWIKIDLGTSYASVDAICITYGDEVGTAHFVFYSSNYTPVALRPFFSSS